MSDKKIIEVSNEWLELKRLSVKHSTFNKYESVINIHFKPFFNNYTISQINDELVISFFNSLFEKNKYSASTLETIRFILKSISNFMQLKYEIRGCFINLIKINKESTPVVTLTKQQKEDLSNHCFINYNAISIAVLISLYGGLRIGEICALKWSNIDFDEGYIHVNKTAERLKNREDMDSKTKVMILNPKTPTSKRIVPIPMFLIEYILEYKRMNNVNVEDDYILTNNKKIPDPRTTQERFSKLCKMFDFRINFHALRHSYATSCVMHNVDIKSLSEILGHSNVGITLNLYVHSSFDFKKKQIDKISRL